MRGQRIFGVVAVCILAVPVVVFGQGQPAGPTPTPHVPITVILSMDALKGKAMQELPPPPPPPPPGPGVLPGKKPGGLLQKIREKKPLQKLLAALAEKQDVAKELEKITQPVNLGGDLWLCLNVGEIVFHGVEVNLGARQLAVELGVQLEPVIVLSKMPPPVPPLPQFALGKEIGPPPPGGTPLSIVLKIDPKSLSQVLPEDTKENLAKYGIDCTQITFTEPPGPKKKLVVAVPLQKPLEANLNVWFTPQIKDNVLTFIDPDCSVMATVPAKKDDSVQQTLQKLTQETIRGLVVNKLKSTTVDFAPHLKKMANLPAAQPAAGPAPKVTAPINNLRVEEVSAENNHLVVRISGTVAPGGIIIGP